MKKEYVVVRIDAAPDGAPYVIISLSSAKDLKEGNQPPSGPNANIMGFSNMDDMMKGLNKMLSGGMGGMGMMPGGQTSLKVDMHEYKELGLSVGDKVYLELSKAESLGV
jgi:phage-related protein